MILNNMDTSNPHCAPDLRGLRVLVVEDNYMLARALESTIVSSGAVVIGPVSTTDAALKLIDHEEFDLALLDIIVQDGVSTLVAERSIALGRPVLFLTGFHCLDMLPPALHGLPCLEKPVDRTDLLEAIQRLARSSG